MTKKQKRNTHKKRQRFLQKRTQRKNKLAQRAVHESATERSGRTLRHARQFPLLGAWVQRDWQQYGVAAVLVARTQPDDNITFGRFLVDTFCVGLKDTFFGVNVEANEFHNDVIPRLYQGEPPLPISIELAHEIIYGAIEYAGDIGFRPPRLFLRTRNILDPEDAHPRSGVIEFGYLGKPTYVPGPKDNQRFILNRLVENVGIDNFRYVVVGDVPKGFEEMLQPTDQPPQIPASAIWIPDQQQTDGEVDSDSGLWVPGQRDDIADPAREEDEPARSTLWAPGT